MHALDSESAASPSPPSFAEALRFWLKLGFISFGGPAGQIAIMHQELVERRRWISDRRFLHALNYCMLLPGPEAQQLATYLGWLMHRTWGGIVAGALFVLPSLLILIALSYVYLRFGDVAWVRGVFDGIKPAVVAIVAFAGWRIGSRVLKHPLLMLIAVAALLGMAWLRLPFPWLILGAGLLGWIGGRLLPAAFRQGPAHAAQASVQMKAWIDDDTPPPRHAEVRWLHATVVLAAALALWAAGYLLIEQATLRAMAEFFSQAALLTFGGAYAVLPYVYESAVQTHGWLSAAQMIDGLALGETTPGPLIMVVAFVGFVGAWGQQILGPDQLLLAGVLGACVATWFTFLPSFVLILLGGPWVERSRDDLRLTAPLTAITAAVVGVIVNLALLFAWHVLWPEASAGELFAGRFAWAELLVMIAALVALWRYKLGVLPVIGACALLGLLRAWVG